MPIKSAPARWRRVPGRWSWLVLSLVGLLWAALVLPAEAQSAIAGQILNDLTGFGMVGIDLDVFDLQGKAVKVSGATSGLNGAYLIDLPGPGTYVVRADPSRVDGFADQFYNNFFLKSAATPITVGAATTVSNINFRLRPGVEILGHVRAAGVAVTNVDLDLYGANGEFLSGYPARTAADGSYAIGALPPGSYLLRADPDPTLGQFYVLSYFNGASNLLSATPIVVSNTTLLNVDIDLAPGGSVSGFVTDQATGLPLAGLDLDVFDTTGAKLEFNAVTDTNGQYHMGPMPVGQYFLRVDPSIADGYARMYYPTSYTLRSSLPLTVTVGQDTPGFDFALPAAGSIAGRLTDALTAQPLSGVDLDVFDALDGRLDISATSDTNGNYVLGPLPVGNFVVRADPALGEGHARSYYPDTVFRKLATPVAVQVGQTTSNIDLALGLAGVISGNIVEAGSSIPLAGVDLDVFDLATNRLDITTKSALDGSYALGPMPAGSYYVRANPNPTSTWSDQYYPDAPRLAAGSLVAVQSSATNAGIDFHLTPGGWMAGVIQNAAGQPLAGIDLDVYEALSGQRLVTGGRTDLNGVFVVGPLHPGTYKLRADPDPQLGYALEYYDGQTTRTNANPITVVGGTGTMGLVMVLEGSATLAGRFTADETGLPVPDMDIDVLEAVTLLRLDQTIKTDLSGRFSIPDIPAGQYILRADPDVLTQPYVRTYYGQTVDPLAATVFSVNAGDSRTNLNIRLFSRKPPAVAIVNPTNGQQVAAGGLVPIAANATDLDGTVTQVAFYSGATLLGVDTNNAFGWDWPAPAPGPVTLWAVATDNAGLSTTSAPVNITVVQMATPVTLQVTLRSDNAVVLTFNTDPGRNYLVEYATQLAPANWQPLATRTGNGQPTLVLDGPPGDPRRFYRVRIE